MQSKKDATKAAEIFLKYFEDRSKGVDYTYSLSAILYLLEGDADLAETISLLLQQYGEEHY